MPTILKSLGRRLTMEKEGKPPRVYVKETERYTCPGCLKETLSYSEEERLFTCSNKDCGSKFALIKVEN